jgi:hypothetical protein
VLADEKIKNAASAALSSRAKNMNVSKNQLRACFGRAVSKIKYHSEQ